MKTPAIAGLALALLSCSTGEGPDVPIPDTSVDPDVVDVADTAGDTGFDTHPDSAPDSAPDTGPDASDTGFDTSVDPAGDDALAPGSVCGDPIDMTGVDSWTGSFASYSNLWTGGTGCGIAGGPEVWFSIVVPDGSIVELDEVTSTLTAIQQVSSCVSATCVSTATSPESLVWYNGTGIDATVLVAVEAVAVGSTDPVSIAVTIGPAPDGYGCRDPVDMSAGAVWTGSYADFANLWDGTTGCGSASGEEVWFEATVPSGNLFHISETTTTNVTIQKVTSCSSTTCDDYASSPERLDHYNASTSPVTLLYAVEAYSPSTASITVEASSAPLTTGYDCAHALDVTASYSWTGSYGDYADLWDGSTGCGTANGQEVWFRAAIPDGDLFIIEETTSTNTTVQIVGSCPSVTCLGYETSPERYQLLNLTGATVTRYIVFESYSASSTDSITVTASIAPPPPGAECTSAIDATSGGTWSGTFAGYGDLWDGGTSCGYASEPDPEVWFSGTVAPGSTFTISETTSSNVTVQRVASCGVTACLENATSPETIAFTNSTGSPTTVYFAIEGYSTSSDPWSVTVTNVP